MFHVKRQEVLFHVKHKNEAKVVLASFFSAILQNSLFSREKI